MANPIKYDLASNAYSGSAIAVTTSEAAIATITDLTFPAKSQITAFYKVTFGSATSVKFRYYASYDNGATYFQIPYRNDSTGQMTDNPTVIDTSSPSQGAGTAQCTEDVPMPACNAFKVTAQSVGAAATLTSFGLLVRDN